MDAIVTYDLTKQYGGTTALFGLNLQIPEGAAFACVGEEGSGKTTLIRLLSGLCRPTSGECSVLGLTPFFETEKLHAQTGTVLDTARLYETMTVSENLRFFASINGVDENDGLDRLSFLLHKLDIWESREGKIDDLPTGVAHRASLARALIHSPRLLLIDAPRDGLDRETADSERELVSYLVEQEGVTVLLCTEDMSYAQRLCGGFAVLRGGALLAKGDLESLQNGAGLRCRAALRLEEGESPPKGFRLRDGFWQKEIGSEKELPRLVSQVVGEGKRLYEVRLIKPSLEEIYAAYLNGGARRAGETDEQDDEYDQAPDGPAEPVPQDADFLQKSAFPDPAPWEEQPGDGAGGETEA